MNGKLRPNLLNSVLTEYRGPTDIRVIHRPVSMPVKIYCVVRLVCCPYIRMTPFPGAPVSSLYLLDFYDLHYLAAQGLYLSIRCLKSLVLSVIKTGN